MWTEIATLRGRKLYTLGRNEEFEVLDVTSSSVTVQPSSSGSKRVIAKRCFDGAFAALSDNGQIDLAGIRQHNEMNPVYIAAILAQLAGVQTQRKPKIVLRLPQA